MQFPALCNALKKAVSVALKKRTTENLEKLPAGYRLWRPYIFGEITIFRQLFSGDNFLILGEIAYFYTDFSRDI